MLTVEEYGRIRRAYREGMSIREISRTYHHSRRKVREALKEAYPKGYRRRKRVVCPVGDAIGERIREILKADAKAPRKQRHTAQQIWRRLQAEGYPGSERTVRRLVAEHRLRNRELYLPLVQDPGVRIEADFGEAEVDFPWGRTTAHLLVLVWSYSSCPFVMAFPTERTEAILEGVSAGLDFYGAVPKEIWWDNPKTVAGKIFRGRKREASADWQKLASHYVFDPKFCLVRKANEKPRAEGLVKYFRKRWLVPVPSFGSWEELNEYLRECCLADRDRKVGKRTVTIAEQWEEDRAAASVLPPYPYDACVREETRSDHQQLVTYDYAFYSVPAEYAFQPVTIKARVHEIEIVHGERTIACHARTYERGEKVLDPLHYLPTLERKPGALDHMDCMRKWQLPSVFERLRTELERRWEGSRGTREYIQVLRLHESYSTSEIAEASQFCLDRGCAGADAIRMHLEQQEQLLSSAEIPSLDLSHLPRLARVEVKSQGLDHFNQLMQDTTIDIISDEFGCYPGDGESVRSKDYYYTEVNGKVHHNISDTDSNHNNILAKGVHTDDRDIHTSLANAFEATAVTRDGP